jgi:3-oxoacyl-[acyl-carrier-protein] synthase II
VAAVSAAIVAAEMITCLGGTRETLDALFAGRTGAAPLAAASGERTGVTHGYPIAGGRAPGRAGSWLRDVVGRVAAAGGIRPSEERVALVIGTGLRQFGDLEGWWAGEHRLEAGDLHFGRVCEEVVPDAEVLTVAGACAASGYALALAGDLLAAGEHDVAIVAGCDGLAESMLAMIGRAAARPVEAVRPFDASRGGVLLGEGAAAVALRPSANGRPPLGHLRGVGISCDAHHPTAPDVAGIARCMRDAHARAAIEPQAVDLVVAHGTGTALNDPAEAEALSGVFGGSGPVVTAIKGAVGHTSGAAALMSAIVALEALRRNAVPPVAGLKSPIPEAAGLRLAVGPAEVPGARVAQCDAFGFGGVDAVAILEAA